MFISGKTSARRLIAYTVFSLCAYAAWARGGTYTSLQWPLLIGALVLCFLPFLLERDRRLPFLLRVYKDPVFSLGFGLMAILLCQWANSNYWVVLRESGGAELARTPLKWLPWSIDRGEAGEMLVWFFPPLVCILFIRNLLHRKHVVAILYLLVANSAVLACLGLIQVAAGTDKILGIWEQPYNTFFASFGYSNHASAWFYLNAFLAGGLAHNAVIKKKPLLQLVVWTLAFVLCVVSVFMTLSRFGAFVSVLLLGVFLMIFLRRTWARFGGGRVLNVYIFSGIIVLFGMALFFGAGGGSLAREVGGKALVGEDSLEGDFMDRINQMGPAWRIVRDYPVFGAGGWNYRWLTRIYIPPGDWNAWSGAGRANIHCDPLQFLTEFGAMGSVCLGGVVVMLVRGVIAARRNVLFYWVSGGLAAVFVHSLIDLPFRCPAVLLSWCCLLAALPCLAQKRGYGG